MTYPATIDVRSPAKIARWRPLLQWLLAIPHLLGLWLLNIVASGLALVSWFAILFTGKLPEGIAKWQVLFLRASNRVSAYAGFLHDEYPPFDLTPGIPEPGGTPTVVQIEPAIEGRKRLTCAVRPIWAIPALFWVAAIGIVAYFAWFIAFFAVVFTGRWPQGLRDWVMKGRRVGLRANAYLYLLTDEYPPFSTD